MLQKILSYIETLLKGKPFFLPGLYQRPQLPQGILPHGSCQMGIQLGIIRAHVLDQLLDLLAHRMAVMWAGGWHRHKSVILDGLPDFLLPEIHQRPDSGSPPPGGKRRRYSKDPCYTCALIVPAISTSKLVKGISSSAIKAPIYGYLYPTAYRYGSTEFIIA